MTKPIRDAALRCALGDLGLPADLECKLERNNNPVTRDYWPQLLFVKVGDRSIGMKIPAWSTLSLSGRVAKIRGPYSAMFPRYITLEDGSVGYADIKVRPYPRERRALRPGDSPVLDYGGRP